MKLVQLECGLMIGEGVATHNQSGLSFFFVNPLSINYPYPKFLPCRSVARKVDDALGEGWFMVHGTRLFGSPLQAFPSKSYTGISLRIPTVGRVTTYS